jgi:dihydroflavonol-4-reductase
MKILVTGANGFLAANIIEELNSRGHEVRAMMRSNADTSALQNLQYECCYGQITKAEDVAIAVTGVDVVIHAAASTAQCQTHYQDTLKVNYDGTKNVIDACVKEKVKRLIYVSTANTFCNGTKEKPGTEEMPFSPLFSRSFYARSKFEAQQLVHKSVKEQGLDAVIVNPAFMLGARDSKPSSGQLILMFLDKKIVFVARGGKSFIHVKDAARGICNAITHGQKGECYLLANQNLSYREFIGVLDKVEGKRKIVVILPTLLLKLAGWIGDMLTFTGVSTPLNSVNMEILETGNYFSSAKAVSQLKIQMTPVEVAIKDAICWFAKNSMIKTQLPSLPL